MRKDTDIMFRWMELQDGGPSMTSDNWKIMLQKAAGLDTKGDIDDRPGKDAKTSDLGMHVDEDQVNEYCDEGTLQVQYEQLWGEDLRPVLPWGLDVVYVVPYLSL